MSTLDYITLSPQEIGKLLSAGNGEAALVYLYMKSTGDYKLDRAQQALHLPAENLRWAESLLKRLDLMDISQTTVRYDPEKAPVYTSEMLTGFTAKDPSFGLLQGEVSRRLGRVLSSEELKTLLSFRDYLKMPPEVISMALTYCLQKNEYYNRVHGKNRTLTMRGFERECYTWANKGIVTLEKASAYISQSLSQLAPENQVKKALGITDRPLVDSEREYIQSWLRMGFPVESIKLAYEKTVVARGGLVWPYLNKILMNWHEKNLHTLQEVRTENRKPAQPEVKSFQPGGEERAAVNNLQKFRDSLKE